MSQSEPVVSVVIPVHDAEATVRRCLGSLRAQRYPYWEALCVDDGSRDGSRDILHREAARDARIRVLSHGTNQGQGAARNRGMAAAQGRYVLHLDADDYLAPGALARLVQEADTDRADITYGRIAHFDRETLDPGTYRHDERYNQVEIHNTRLADYPSLVHAHNTLNRLYCRAFLEAAGLQFETEPRYAEDVLFSLRANLAAERITICTEVTYFYAAGNYLGAAIPEKVRAARDNRLRALELVRARAHPRVVREMERKQAMEVGHIERAVAAFPQRAELLAFLETLQPLARAVPEAVVADLEEPLERQMCWLLREGRCAEALEAFEAANPKPLPPWLDRAAVHWLAPRIPDALKAPVKRILGRR